MAAARTAARRAVYFGTLWPQASASAGGVRTLGLVDTLLGGGYEVTYASPARENEHAAALASRGVRVVQLPPNNAAAAEELVQRAAPHVALFDRFIMEEQFSHVVWRTRPDCLRVLDTQDLHSSRLGRQRLIEAGGSVAESVAYVPDADNADAQREVAAMHRSDLVVMCSLAELQLLQHGGAARRSSGLTDPSWLSCDASAADGASATPAFALPRHKLAYAPFAYPDADVAEANQRSKPFSRRKHFCVIGNFRHKPNADGTRWLAEQVWPLVRAKLPEAQMRVFGAYPTADDLALTDRDAGFIVRGHAKDLTFMASHKVQIAPLRFGAGIKGKIVDGWNHGLPTVTTPIGGEGMELLGADGSQPWGGRRRAVTAEQLVEDAVELYTNEKLWEGAVRAGHHIVDTAYTASRSMPALLAAIDGALEHLEQRRRADVLQAALWSQGMRAADFMARWIEEKNRNKMA